MGIRSSAWGNHRMMVDVSGSDVMCFVTRVCTCWREQGQAGEMTKSRCVHVGIVVRQLCVLTRPHRVSVLSMSVAMAATTMSRWINNILGVVLLCVFIHFV